MSLFESLELNLFNYAKVRESINRLKQDSLEENAYRVSELLYCLMPTRETAYFVVVAVEGTYYSSEYSEGLTRKYRRDAGDVDDGGDWETKTIPEFFPDTPAPPPLVQDPSSPLNEGVFVMTPQALYRLFQIEYPQKYEDENVMKYANMLNDHWRDPLKRPRLVQDVPHKGKGAFAPFDIPHGIPQPKKKGKRRNRITAPKKEGTLIGFYLGRLADQTESNDAILDIRGFRISARKPSGPDGKQGEMLHWVGFINDNVKIKKKVPVGDAEEEKPESVVPKAKINVQMNGRGAIYTLRNIKEGDEFLMKYEGYEGDRSYWKHHKP